MYGPGGKCNFNYETINPVCIALQIAENIYLVYSGNDRVNSLILSEVGKWMCRALKPDPLPVHADSDAHDLPPSNCVSALMVRRDAR